MPGRDNYVVNARAVVDRIEHHPADFHAALDAFTASFDRFEHSQETLADAIKAERDREAAVAETLYIVSLAVVVSSVLAMAAAMAWSRRLVMRRVVRPIESLAGTFHRMAHGDFGEQIAGNPGGDEVEQMMTAAAVFRETAMAMRQSEQDQQQVVTELATGLGKLAGRDLEYRIAIPLPAHYEALRTNFNQAARALASALGSVRVGANELTNSISEIRSAADDLSEGLGGYVNAEKELTATLGFFMRASVADGRYAVFDFTDIDRSVSAGFTLAGKGWGRADDTISLGLVASGIDTVKRAYFAAGGLGLLIGDGMLEHYGTEAIAEASYSWHPIKPVAITFDAQMVANPAYNRDRGPVGLLGLRLHAAF